MSIKNLPVIFISWSKKEIWIPVSTTCNRIAVSSLYYQLQVFLRLGKWHANDFSALDGFNFKVLKSYRHTVVVPPTLVSKGNYIRNNIGCSSPFEFYHMPNHYISLCMDYEKIKCPLYLVWLLTLKCTLFLFCKINIVSFNATSPWFL